MVDLHAQRSAGMRSTLLGKSTGQQQRRRTPTASVSRRQWGVFLPRTYFRQAHASRGTTVLLWTGEDRERPYIRDAVPPDPRVQQSGAADRSHSAQSPPRGRLETFRTTCPAILLHPLPISKPGWSPLAFQPLPSGGGLGGI